MSSRAGIRSPVSEVLCRLFRFSQPDTTSQPWRLVRSLSSINLPPWGQSWEGGVRGESMAPNRAHPYPQYMVVLSTNTFRGTMIRCCSSLLLSSFSVIISGNIPMTADLARWAASAKRLILFTSMSSGIICPLIKSVIFSETGFSVSHLLSLCVLAWKIKECVLWCQIGMRNTHMWQCSSFHLIQVHLVRAVTCQGCCYVVRW